MVMSTLGAFIAIRPARFEKSLFALNFCAICAANCFQTKTSLKLYFVLSHDFSPPKFLRRLGHAWSDKWFRPITKFLAEL